LISVDIQHTSRCTLLTLLKQSIIADMGKFGGNLESAFYIFMMNQNVKYCLISDDKSVGTIFAVG